MALAASLIPGLKYRIESGRDEGVVVTIEDNTAFPDCQDVRNGGSAHKNGLPHDCSDPQGLARKITVRMPDGSQEYILPRMLSGNAIGVADDSPLAGSVSVPVWNAPPAIVPEGLRLDEDDPQEAPVRPLLADVTTLDYKDIKDPMDPRLDAFRPSVTKAKRYENRTMLNGMTDVAALLTYTTDDYRAENEGRPANIMLKGDTQSGKTMLVEVLAIRWAEAMGLPKPMPIFTLSGSSGVTDYDLFGQTTSYTDPATGHEFLVWLPGLVDLAARVGGILYLDEINAMPERVVSSLHPISDSRHLFINRNKPVFKNGQFMPETVNGSFDLWIIGTYNEGYRGMGEVGQAMVNRFRTFRWDYDETVEAKLVKSPAIRLLAQHIRLARQGNKVRTPVGTAALQRLERDLVHFGIPMALDTFTGMFPAAEVDKVKAIIKDETIDTMLVEERRQNDANNAVQAPGTWT